MKRPHITSEIPDLTPHERGQVVAAAAELQRKGAQIGVLILPHRDGLFSLERIGARRYRLRRSDDGIGLTREAVL